MRDPSATVVPFDAALHDFIALIKDGVLGNKEENVHRQRVGIEFPALFKK